MALKRNAPYAGVITDTTDLKQYDVPVSSRSCPKIGEVAAK